LRRTRSDQRVVQSQIEIKRWMETVPSVGDVRPACCPACASAGAPIGKRIVIVGHGLRRREVEGPTDHEDAGGAGFVLWLRRYLCRACGAVLTVVPRGILRCRRYCAFAIAWALALFGLLRLPAKIVRERMTCWRETPWTTNPAWAAVIRWVRAVRDRRLFCGLPRSPPSVSLRRVAERAAMALAGAAPAELRALAEDVKAAYGGVVISSMGIGV